MSLDARELLHRMVAIPSVSTQEEPLVSDLVDVLTYHGWDAHSDEAGNLIARRGEGGPEAVLLGHVDTVPGDLSVYDDGLALHGRGSVDAKGPLAAFLVAVDRLANADKLPGSVTVIGCVEEEAASSKGARFAVNRPAPDYCVVGEPSGWDGITLGYKGYLAMEASFTVKKSHGAHDHRTAPELAFDAWSQLNDAVAERDRDREKLFDRVLTSLASLQTLDDGVRQTTLACINLRLPLDLGPEAAALWATAHLPEASIRFLGRVPAWAGPRTSTLARGLFRAIHGEGGKARYLHKTGTADLNIVAPVWGCPALAYGPGDAALDHTPEEHQLWEDYERAIRVLETLIATSPSWLSPAE